MRSGADLERLAAALRSPLGEFVRETRARLALLINRSGQVLAQQGFSRGYELVNVAALAAAANASSGVLAELTGVLRWRHLHHAGRTREVFLAQIETPAEQVILVTIFEQDSTLGIVQHFAEQLAVQLAQLPELRVLGGPAELHRFEQDLEAGLQQMWGS